MHRLLDLLGDKVVRMLTTQYRFVILSVSRLFFFPTTRAAFAPFLARETRALYGQSTTAVLWNICSDHTFLLGNIK